MTLGSGNKLSKINDSCYGAYGSVEGLSNELGGFSVEIFSPKIPLTQFIILHERGDAFGASIHIG